MVAEINPTGVNLTSQSTSDTAKSKQDKADSSFAEALSKSDNASVQAKKTGAVDVEETKSSNANKNQNNKDVKADSNEEKNTKSATKIVTTDSKKQQETKPLGSSALVKAKTTKEANDSQDSPLAKILNQDSNSLEDIEGELGNEDRESPQDVSDDLTSDLISSDSKISNNNKTIKPNTESKEIKLPSGGATNLDGDMTDIAESEDSSEDIASESREARKPDSKGNLEVKTLNDVKKEAQAKSLNLQKMEIIQDGQKTKVDPRELVDRDILEGNRERLSGSLQSRGAAVANSISQSAQDISAPMLGGPKPELSQKEQLLAELLNRYDAAENARRKAQN
ncbi:hypothetical protein CQA44_11270, partial [Helicobacter sp. MIT 14-3879]